MRENVVMMVACPWRISPERKVGEKSGRVDLRGDELKDRHGQRGKKEERNGNNEACFVFISAFRQK